jgi:hypothetical protein
MVAECGANPNKSLHFLWIEPHSATTGHGIMRLTNHKYGFMVLNMKTTLELPDRLYRQIKARAALRGQTVKAFFLDAVRDKLAADRGAAKRETGWRAVFGKAKPADVDDVQRILDAEFEQIDPEGWN